MKMRAHLAKENCASLPESHIRPNDNNFASLFFVEIINYSNKPNCWRKENGTQCFVQVMMSGERERGGEENAVIEGYANGHARSLPLALSLSLFPYLLDFKNATTWLGFYFSFFWTKTKMRLASFSKASLWLSKRTEFMCQSCKRTDAQRDTGMNVFDMCVAYVANVIVEP